MKTFNELRKLNVNELLEKKGNLSYLSWAHAVDTLLQNDPSATWVFPEPVMFGANEDEGLEYLLTCITDGARDNFVWNYLRDTGDLSYDLNTFKKVHKAITEKTE